MHSNLVETVSKDAATASTPEEALVAAAKAGDELAFETLVKRHESRIFVLALRYTRVQADAEDIVQQTLQKAFVSLQKFEGKSSFATWLTRIGINEALQWLRKGRVRREVPMEDSTSDERAWPNPEIPDARPDPEANYLRQEGTQILSEALGHLSPGMRSALELRDLRELTSRETAQYMGLSIAAVKARVFHGRKKLREALIHYMKSPCATDTNAGGYFPQ